MTRIPSPERGCHGKIRLGSTGYKGSADRMARKHGKRYGMYRSPHCGSTHLTNHIEVAERYFEPPLYVTA
jgi:hypothetical protein